jgi:hypothetical protein
MDDIVATCARSLFGTYAVALSDAAGEGAAPPPAGDTVAVVGFAGDRVRGSLLIRAPRAVFARSYASACGEPPEGDGDLESWAAELANLLLGRVKRALLGYGVALRVSTPEAFRAAGAARAARGAPPAGAAECVARRFEADGAPVHVALVAVTEPGFALDPAPDAPRLAPEGDAMFF